MRVREFATAQEAFDACGPDEVVGIYRGVGVPDRYGVLPRVVTAGEREQPVGEFLQSVGGYVEAEARKVAS
jgi:hypothetical protein